MTTSTFSAEPGNAQSIREGWLAQAADDLIDSKRYTGIDATEVWGTMTNVLRDCPNECDAKGETFNNVITGKLKGVAPITQISPCGSVIEIVVATQWTNFSFGDCLNQAIQWWKQHHYDRIILKTMTGVRPECSVIDTSPTPGYTSGCSGPITAQGPHPTCINSVDECNLNPTTDFLYAVGFNQVRFEIKDGGNRVFASDVGGHGHRGSINSSGFACCQEGVGNYDVIGSAMIYDGPPANPSWPVDDVRRYAGNYFLTNGLNLGVHSATFVVSFP